MHVRATPKVLGEYSPSVRNRFKKSRAFRKSRFYKWLGQFFLEPIFIKNLFVSFLRHAQIDAFYFYTVRRHTIQRWVCVRDFFFYKTEQAVLCFLKACAYKSSTFGDRFVTPSFCTNLAPSLTFGAHVRAHRRWEKGTPCATALKKALLFRKGVAFALKVLQVRALHQLHVRTQVLCSIKGWYKSSYKAVTNCLLCQRFVWALDRAQHVHVRATAQVVPFSQIFDLCGTKYKSVVPFGCTYVRTEGENDCVCSPSVLRVRASLRGSQVRAHLAPLFRTNLVPFSCTYVQHLRWCTYVQHLRWCTYVQHLRCCTYVQPKGKQISHLRWTLRGTICAERFLRKARGLVQIVFRALHQRCCAYDPLRGKCLRPLRKSQGLAELLTCNRFVLVTVL